MLPLPCCINQQKWPPSPEVTVVNLLSSLMIVCSNAFVYSTCLLEVVSRYGYIIIIIILLFFQNTLSLYKGLYCKKDFLIILSIRLIYLEAVTLIKYHKLKARVLYPFSLLMSALSLELSI